MSQSAGRWKQRGEEFHTDYFRAIDAGDIIGSKVPWFKSEMAKKDIEVEVSKLTGGAPRSGKAKQGEDARGQGDVLGGGQHGLDKKLAELTRRTADVGKEWGKTGRKKARHNGGSRERDK